MTRTDALRPRRRSTVSVDVGGICWSGTPHQFIVPVDDEHGHGRCRRNSDPGRPSGPAPAPSSSESPSTPRRPPQPSREMIRKLRDNLGVDVPVISDFHLQRPQAPGGSPEMAAEPSPSTGSTPATWVPNVTTSTSRRSSESRSTTTSRWSGYGSTGARWTTAMPDQADERRTHVRHGAPRCS